MDKIDTDELRRMDAARTGPQVTCPASRHAGMIAEALIAGNEDQQHQGGSIASTVASLWEARAEILASRAREAELQAEVARLRVIVGKGPTHRHVKRGTLYRHLGTGRIQSDEPLTDGAEVEIYHGAHGDLWARRKVEFHDGRFYALSHLASGEGAA